MKNRAIIVVPVYRDFDNTERTSFLQGITVLKDYTFNLLHPQRYSVSKIMEEYGSMAHLTETALDDSHFTGVQSYSDLLLTEEFYDLYSGYEYMLIYQLDAYVFENKLAYWLDKGYDYVGAPWVPTEYYYKKIVGMIHQKIRRMFPSSIYDIPHCFKYFAVGNGGFSLRKISTMRQIMHDDKEIIGRCDYYEDWYISQVATRTHRLNIPDWHEALTFSFEQSLKHCYALNGKRLPFGCHYWSRQKNYKRFWHKFIEIV